MLYEVITEHIEAALDAMQQHYGDDALSFRMETDESYFKAQLRSWHNDTAAQLPLHAFDRHLTYGEKQLTQVQRDALIRFLFEESVITSYSIHYTKLYEASRTGRQCTYEWRMKPTGSDPPRRARPI